MVLEIIGKNARKKVKMAVLRPIFCQYLRDQDLCGPCGNEIVVASFLQHFGISKAAVGRKLVYHSLTSAKTKRAKLQFFSLSCSQCT